MRIALFHTDSKAVAHFDSSVSFNSRYRVVELLTIAITNRRLALGAPPFVTPRASVQEENRSEWPQERELRPS
jgi:hypothetical protein